MKRTMKAERTITEWWWSHANGKCGGAVDLKHFSKKGLTVNPPHFFCEQCGEIKDHTVTLSLEKSIYPRGDWLPSEVRAYSTRNRQYRRFNAVRKLQPLSRRARHRDVPS